MKTRNDVADKGRLLLPGKLTKTSGNEQLGESRMINGLPRSLGPDPNAFRDGELVTHALIDGSRLAAV